MIPFRTQIFEKPENTLTLLMILVTLPHFQYIPWWSVSCIVLLTVWRVLITQKLVKPVNRILSSAMTLLLAVFVYKYSNGFSGITAGSHLLVIMTFCKLIESNTHREHMLLVILSFFIMSTNFLFSQNIPTAIYMFFCLFMAIYALLIINQKDSQLNLTSNIKTASKLIGYAIPLMIILFIFFPRITGPLWNTNSDVKQARTGLSDTMEPGQISNLIYSNDLVFRATFDQQTPPNNLLYWRALTLWRFNGKKWSANTEQELDTVIRVNSSGYEYQIILEPSQNKWLFLLDMPYKINRGLALLPDFTSRLKKSEHGLLQYSASSSPDYFLRNQLDSVSRSKALQLPDLNPHTKKLALSWQQSATNTNDIIQKALRHFSGKNFYYTLSPPGLSRTDSVDQFLFETQRGFCEHYASAFTVLMRSAGIPARIVLGYLGGNINPYNNSLSVDQSMAHAWTEVWIENKGWTRVDPTASIAPERVEKNLASALQNQPDIPLHLKIDFAFIDKVKQMLDVIDNNWNQWILNYNEKNQKHLLELLTGSSFRLRDFSHLFIQILIATFSISGIIYFFTGLRKKTDEVTESYQTFCKKLSRAGCERETSEGPADFRKRLNRLFPSQRAEINKIFDLYIELKFKKNNSTGTASRFITAVRQFRISKSH